jgi:uncharacterized membrane protein YhaH (DUF805 family)
MDEPFLSGLLRFSGRRSRASYAKVLALFVFTQVAFIYVALVKAEPWAWMLYVGVSSVVGLMHTVALAQRFRDTGLSGWNVIVLLVPVIGFFIALAMALRPGQTGANRYGPDPLHDPLLGRQSAWTVRR